MRRSLVAAIAGVAALSVLVLAGPLALFVRSSYRDRDLLRLQRDALAASRTLDAGRGGDPVELPAFDGIVAVYGRDGTLAAGRGARTADPLTRRVLRSGRPAGERRAGALVTSVPLIRAERVVGAVRAARSDQATGRRVRNALAVLLGAALAIVALGVGAAVLLARRLARPLERVAGAARRLADGDLAARAPAARIPEVDDVAAALNGAAQRLGDALARERTFSADASHQLRTPLQALRIELEGKQLAGDASPELGAALAQVDRLERVIETLLRAARDVPRPSVATAVGAAAAEAARRWHGVLAAAGRPLRVDPGLDGLRAQAAPGVLDEILEVLLSNAARHGRGPVTVGGAVAGDWVTVEVRDEGPGLGPGAERLFGRRAAARDGGHGIGLALARALARGEGGELLAAAGAPTSLILRLRAAPDAPPPARPGRR